MIFAVVQLLSFVYSAAVPPPDYEYTGPTGPDFWYTLSPTYGICKTGKMQSPIDINNRTLADFVTVSKNAVKANWTTVPSAKLEDYGKTVDLEFSPVNAPTLQYSLKEYKMANIHAHIESEHKLFGKQYPMEVHFVHQDAANNLLVVGVFIEIGMATHPFFDVFLKSGLPNVKGASVNLQNVDLSLILKTIDNLAKVYTYQGSLTTPPCTEGVQWVVSYPLKNPTITKNDWELIRSYFPKPDNDRPVQRY